MRDTRDICARCGGYLSISGHLGGIEYRGCETCGADHTWNVNRPWDNPARIAYLHPQPKRGR